MKRLCSSSVEAQSSLSICRRSSISAAPCTASAMRIARSGNSSRISLRESPDRSAASSASRANRSNRGSSPSARKASDDTLSAIHLSTNATPRSDIVPSSAWLKPMMNAAIVRLVARTKEGVMPDHAPSATAPRGVPRATASPVPRMSVRRTRHGRLRPRPSRPGAMPFWLTPMPSLQRWRTASDHSRLSRPFSPSCLRWSGLSDQSAGRSSGGD